MLWLVGDKSLEKGTKVGNIQRTSNAVVVEMLLRKVPRLHLVMSNNDLCWLLGALAHLG